MDSMCQTAEEFYQGLEIPYRIVNIVSGLFLSFVLFECLSVYYLLSSCLT